MCQELENTLLSAVRQGRLPKSPQAGLQNMNFLLPGIDPVTSMFLELN